MGQYTSIQTMASIDMVKICVHIPIIAEYILKSGIIIYDDKEFDKRFDKGSKAKHSFDETELKTMRFMGQTLHRVGGIRGMEFAATSILSSVTQTLNEKCSNKETANKNMFHVGLLIDSAWDGIGDYKQRPVLIIHE
jgi:hypothetical protein